MPTRQRESKLSSKIVAYLNKQPHAFFWKLHEDMYGINGMPDIVGVYRGQFVGVEVKLLGEQLTPIQSRRKFLLEQADGVVFVVHSLAELRVQFGQLAQKFARKALIEFFAREDLDYDGDSPA